MLKLALISEPPAHEITSKCLFFHRQDWGAILLIDERFNKSPKYINGKNNQTAATLVRYLNILLISSGILTRKGPLEA